MLAFLVACFVFCVSIVVVDLIRLHRNQRETHVKRKRIDIYV